MAVTVAERISSRKISSGTNPSAQIEVVIQGTADEETAIIAAEGFVPSGQSSQYAYVVGVLYLQRTTISVEPIHVDADNDDASLWYGSINYEASNSGSPDSQSRDNSQTEPDSSFSFEIGGGTQHITQSLATTGSYVASGTAPDFKQAIGVTKDNVEGVDITVPVYTFTESHSKKYSEVTHAYKNTLMGLCAKTNNSTFRGFAPGEVLFQGCSASRNGDDKDDLWAITYRFAVSKNAVNLTIGDITVASKKGWEYLWCVYSDSIDNTAKMPIKKPIAAYTEKVYEEGDFDDLDIPDVGS